MTKTSKIFELNAPYNNQYQGVWTRLLFVCSVGMLRSPTAAEVGIKLGYNCRSCGTDKVALIPLSANLIMWADKIIFMNNENYQEALKTFDNTGYEEDVVLKSWVVGIDDDYNFADTHLQLMIERWIENKQNSGLLNNDRTTL